ncbi:MAG: hydroxyphenylacetyl-CoA thioesterase PaaI [Bdellovibrionales bacterium]|nr:hydroxyphenylacetyl-CoA thioesterase PaaI [Bdellovibrionales bacterium]
MNSPEELAQAVVKKMYDNDPFSQWLGIEVSGVAPHKATCTMEVRKEMLNGFGVTHGGIAYSLADSAFAFASNTVGQVSVSIDNSISYPAPVRPGDTLTASAELRSAANRVATYDVNVINQDNTVVALFRGTVYRTKKQHFPESN